MKRAFKTHRPSSPSRIGQRNRIPSETQRDGMPTPAALQRRFGNRGARAWLAAQAPTQQLQCKLTVGQPGDIYEQEADRVAETVMRMPTPMVLEDEDTMVQAKSIADQIIPVVGSIREETGAAESTVRPNFRLGSDQDDQTPQENPITAAQIQALNSGGSSLSRSTRSFFEPRFGADFSKVRVHSDKRAAETATSINARAFTAGSNISFGTNQYAPNSYAGRRLLAHELAHVVQQTKQASGEARYPFVLQRACTPRALSRADYLQQPYTSTETFGLTRLNTSQVTYPIVRIRQGRVQSTMAALPNITSIYTGEGRFDEGQVTLEAANGCPRDTYILHWSISPEAAQRIELAEQEHCNDYQYAFDTSLRTYAEAVNRLSQRNRSFTNVRAAKRHLARQLGVSPDDWADVFRCLVCKTKVRDDQGWHTPRHRQDAPDRRNNCRLRRWIISASLPQVGQTSSNNLITGCTTTEDRQRTLDRCRESESSTRAEVVPQRLNDQTSWWGSVISSKQSPLVQSQHDPEHRVEKSTHGVQSGLKQSESARFSLRHSFVQITSKSSTQSTKLDANFKDYINSLRGGEFLTKPDRAYFESRFGRNFDTVRIHDDSRSDSAANALGAKAFTVGRHIVFSAGQYAPGTATGKRLLAHELAHVVQQTAGQSESTANSGQMLQLSTSCDRPLTITKVLTGPFHGGFSMDDYFPDLAGQGFWSHSNTAGPFESDSTMGPRAGWNVQIYGSIPSPCRPGLFSLAQTVTLRRHRVNGTPQPDEGQTEDDIAQSRRDASAPPFRREWLGDPLGFNISMADPVSVGFTRLLLTPTRIEDDRDYVTSLIGPNGLRSVSWSFSVRIENGQVTRNTVR